LRRLLREAQEAAQESQRTCRRLLAALQESIAEAERLRNPAADKPLAIGPKSWPVRGNGEVN